MNDKKHIIKPRPISGFPEWLPEVRMVEQAWLDHIRRVFESYGYASIETPAVEELAIIAAKGEDVDKEIYVLERLQADPDDKKDARLALHFDQTVPLARYVAQNFNELVFPFKRYQMQKVWRGERPQMGRMREFYQCDIDVINVDSLPLSFDAEVAAVMHEILSGLDIGRVQIRISNRKIVLGFLDGIHISTRDGKRIKFSEEQKTQIIRDIDKLEKIGKETTLNRIENTCLIAGLGFSVDTLIKPFLDICETKIATAEDLEDFYEKMVCIEGIDTSNKILKEGISELAFVMDNLAHLPEGAVVADLSIVRGLDYYTGTVYETQLLDVPEFTGSVCSGGRYDDLAGSYINKHLPGVGISIGFTRLFDVMRQTGRLKIGAKGPAQILILLLEESQRAAANAKARDLRAQGFNVEVYHAPSKISRQFAYAEKKGLPFVYVPMDEAAQMWEIKNMTTRTQMSEAEGVKEIKGR